MLNWFLRFSESWDAPGKPFQFGLSLGFFLSTKFAVGSCVTSHRYYRKEGFHIRIVANLILSCSRNLQKSPVFPENGLIQWRSQDFGSRGTFEEVSRVGGTGAEPLPRTPENFRKISKNFEWKLLKMHYFSIFFEKVNKPCVNFSCVWTKNTDFWEILKIIRNFLKNFRRKLQKIHYFSIFFKKINKPMRSFFAVWTKNIKCWEILRNFWKFLIKIQQENWIFNDFWKSCC